MGQPGRCTSCGMPTAGLATTDGFCDRCRSARDAGNASEEAAAFERSLLGGERTVTRTPGETSPAPDLTETFDRKVADAG